MLIDSNDEGWYHNPYIADHDSSVHVIDPNEPQPETSSIDTVSELSLDPEGARPIDKTSPEASRSSIDTSHETNVSPVDPARGSSGYDQEDTDFSHGQAADSDRTPAVGEGGPQIPGRPALEAQVSSERIQTHLEDYFHSLAKL